jgi:crotonobetainyl-CoA:carnitine CoA-transferase CaiB-like acyl-CoA transferase
MTQLMGMPNLADDERFSSVVGRMKNHDALDKIISDWTLTQTKFDVMYRLQQNGIAAGAVLNSPDIFNDPHAKARQFFDDIDQTSVGVRTIPGRLWKFGETEVPQRRPAPDLGEHNDYVLKELLGLSAAEVAELERTKIIGTEPVESQEPMG